MSAYFLFFQQMFSAWFRPDQSISGCNVHTHSYQISQSATIHLIFPMSLCPRHFPPCPLWPHQMHHTRSSPLAACCSLDQVQSVLVSMRMLERCHPGLPLKTESGQQWMQKDIRTSVFRFCSGDPVANVHEMRQALICIRCSISLWTSLPNNLRQETSIADF